MGFRKPACRVEINGVDYTDRFQPLVKSIKVSDKDGLTSDTCTIKLADSGGAIALPDENDMLTVYLGDAEAGVGLVFQGRIDGVRSTGTSGGGQELTISAKGFDATGKAKGVKEKHKDNAKFGDVAKEWGKASGMTDVVIDDDLASIEDEYWSMNNESFIGWGQRVAGEIGATFKVQGDRAMFLSADGGKTARGRSIPDFTVTRGDNLLRWDISPIRGRPGHQKVDVEFYSAKDGKLKTKQIEVDGQKSEVSLRSKVRASDEKNAERIARSGGKKVKRKGGSGTVTIVGSHLVKPEGKLILVGAREGIDGEYRITGVEHDYSSKGYDVDLTVEQPQGKAGKDSRRKTKSTS
ncbi:phage late control D family protein [Bosea massiliensis]|uniref:Phage late control D family protein n=1 Tax=Bosea massiliensis TaxID=151419 RepID=A0ABW0PBM3_9HYPH